MQYKTKEGSYYSTPIHFGFHLGKTKQTVRVKFDRSCLYPPIDWENDYNKLFGWSYGLHHKNSVRVGWRPYIKNGQETLYIELCLYVYKDGERMINTQTILVPVDLEFTLVLEVLEDNVFMTVYDGEWVTEEEPLTSYLTVSMKPCWGYLLYPYFGGNNPAPQTVKVSISYD